MTNNDETSGDGVLPCPFCGGDKLFRTSDNINATDRINCKSCKANAVLWKWNTRAKQASEVGNVIETLKEAEQQLLFVKGKEIGVHRPGEKEPYYTSWNDGEYAISMAWHLVVAAQVQLSAAAKLNNSKPETLQSDTGREE